MLLVIDASEGVTEQDAKIAGVAHEKGKGILVVVNKWDLVEKDGKTMKEFTEKISGNPFLHELCGVPLCVGCDGPAHEQAL